MVRTLSLAATLSAALLVGVMADAASAEPSAHAEALCTTIDEKAARHIAWTHGLIHLEEIMLMGHRWEVAGRDREGFEMTLDIGACSGKILQ